jgi:hypothetical protein
MGPYPPPRTTDGASQGIPKTRGQAGVLLAVHKDLLAGTEPHTLPLPAETQGFIYQMEIRRPESVPLLITGAYLPTGPSAPLIRPILYNHIEHIQRANPSHVHLLAGDMNAALYPTDQAPGRRGPLDQPSRQLYKTWTFSHWTSPSPRTPPSQVDPERTTPRMTPP